MQQRSLAWCHSRSLSLSLAFHTCVEGVFEGDVGGEGCWVELSGGWASVGFHHMSGGSRRAGAHDVWIQYLNLWFILIHI